MALHTIAILSPGDMGHAVGWALREHGHDVITCLAGRSEPTRARAERAGFRDVPDLEALVGEADLVLSILPPEMAEDTAVRVAAAMAAAGATPPYADCNAVAPETSRSIGSVIESAGAPFIDCGIVGLAPRNGGKPTRFFVSGPDAAIMAELDGKGIDIRDCGAELGDASAVKMCYAAVSKGTNTLHTAALMAAEALGVGELVRAEFAYSNAATYERMRASVSRLPADSARWVREMEEISKTFESCGVTPHFHMGARDVFELLAKTPFAAESRETIDPTRTMEESVTEFVRQLPSREAAE